MREGVAHVYNNPDLRRGQGKVNLFSRNPHRSRNHSLAQWALHGLGATSLFSVKPLRRVRGSIHRATGA
jgi:hypothetical protein